MPRLDNSAIEVQEAFGYEFNYNDPGDTGPIDVCIDCYDWLGLPGDCAHPPYEDLDYVCEQCGKLLTEEDN